MLSTACERSFERLKKSFVSAPILPHFNPEGKIVVELDTSNLVVTRVLSPFDDDHILHPVTYFSRKHFTAEINYKMYKSKLLAIVQAFNEFCPLLEGSPHTIVEMSDHQTLTFFTNNCLFNYHQTRWSEILSCFDFKIDYRPGKAHNKANAIRH
jgi:hypothetical protein